MLLGQQLARSVAPPKRGEASTPFVLSTSPRAPDVNEVIAGLEPGDCILGALVGAASFPLGYAIGAPIRKPAMWTCGFLGSVCGFLLAYQNSCGESLSFGVCFEHFVCKQCFKKSGFENGYVASASPIEPRRRVELFPAPFVYCKHSLSLPPPPSKPFGFQCFTYCGNDD